jgi:hypothetical protein
MIGRVIDGSNGYLRWVDIDDMAGRSTRSRGIEEGNVVVE